MSKLNHSPAGAAMTELVLEVFRVNGLLLAAGDLLTKDLGLSSARWQVMGALVDGPLTAAQIARTMGLQRQSVQRLVDLLNDEQIVAFEDNPHHRRAKLVRLTQAGQRKYAQISRKQVLWVNELSGGFEVRALRDAVALMREMEARLREE